MMKFTVAKRDNQPRQAVATLPVAPVPEEQIGLIQGQVPMSKEEWRVAVALWEYKVRFLYQFDIYGGNTIRGGQVVDFLCWIPFPTPVPVNGEYWHKGQMSPDEDLKMELLRIYFKRDPIILWGDELRDQEMAYRTVKEKLKL